MDSPGVAENLSFPRPAFVPFAAQDGEKCELSTSSPGRGLPALSKRLGSVRFGISSPGAGKDNVQL
jgi:hypothetical protein